MIRFTDFTGSRLSSRFLLWMAANTIAFLLITAFLLISFDQIRNYSRKVTANHLNDVLADADRAQRVAVLFQTINSIEHQIFTGNKIWQQTRKNLRGEISAIVDQVEDKEAKHSLGAIVTSLSRFAKGNQEVSNLLLEISTQNVNVRHEIDELERLINNRLINVNLHLGETRRIKRLLAWVASIKVSWQDIDKLHLEQQIGYLSNGIEYQDGSAAIVGAIDELHSNLKTLAEPAIEVAWQESGIARALMRYRSAILHLRDAISELSIRLEYLQIDKKAVLDLFGRPGLNSDESAALLTGDVEDIFKSTGISVIAVSLLVLLGSAIFTVFLFRRYVRKPLRKIINSIAEIDGVAGLVDPSAHNIEGDEWAIIDYALKSMQGELFSQLNAIQNSEARYKLLVENQGDMIVKMDPEGHFQFVSPTYCQTFGKSQSVLLGSVSPITLLAKGRGEQGRTMMDLYRPPYECLLEQRSLTTKGWRWFSWNHRALLDDKRQVSAIVSVGRDVTDRKQAEMELDRQRRFLRTVIDAVADPILVIGKDYQIKMYNSAALKSYGNKDGIESAELTGLCHKITFGENEPCDNTGHPCPLHQVLKTGQSTTALHLHNTANGECTFELSASPFADSEGRILGIVQVSRDITEKLKAEDRIRFLAHHDALTGLPNRVLLRDRFTQAVNYADRAGHSVAVLFLDLDHFKDVNDSLGHKVGDRLLQEVVARLSSIVRSSDTVSRLGGDEFVVVIPQAEVQGAPEQIAGHFLKELNEPFYIDRHNLRLSASIGISLYPIDGEEFDTLLKNADTAMYSAKEAGRNTFRFYSSEMNQANTSRLHTLSLLKQALEREEFNLFYQPQVEMNTGRIIGMEALVSWNTHNLGRLRPGQFISLAEESGLIVPLGNWILHTACRQVNQWNQEYGCSIPVAVNLSALQIRQENFTDSVLAALDQSGLPASLLDLELTESMLLQDTNNVLKTVTELKSHGVNLIMDDFGTGYSSLSYLKKFKLTGLKIDRSFITDLTHESEDAAIVRTIIQMSRSLGLTVVAEGVESIEQVAWLQREGCEWAQGYYYYKPMDALNLAQVLSLQQSGATLALEK
ncbi:MAG: EAL domain-containing protein [Gammaproteobacteria bacterium]|nr:EAL domain-containing protein [Gammaproteobacteria bacterium]